MKLFKILAITLLLPALVHSQTGNNTYEFLNISNSARISALGGINVSLPDIDQSIAYYNPALLSNKMDNNLSLNYLQGLGGLKTGYVSYVKDVDKKGTFGLAIQYLNGGDFDGYDETGVATYKFTAAEYAVAVMWSRKLWKNVDGGVTFKPVMSFFEAYNSFGLLVDAGIKYHQPEKNFSAGLVLRNAGTQFYGYTENNLEAMPFEIAGGITKRLAHAPFRISITARHLQQPDLSKVDNTPNSLGNTVVSPLIKEPTFINKTLQHLIFGLEFIPSKNFYFAGSYNFMRNIELKNAGIRGSEGFAWGFGINLKRYKFGFGSANLIKGISTKSFSLNLNLSEFNR